MLYLCDLIQCGAVFNPTEIIPKHKDDRNANTEESTSDNDGIVYRKGILTYNEDCFNVVVKQKPSHLTRVVRVSADSRHEAMERRKALLKIRNNGVRSNLNGLALTVLSRIVRTIIYWLIILLDLLCVALSVLFTITKNDVVFGISLIIVSIYFLFAATLNRMYLTNPSYRGKLRFKRAFEGDEEEDEDDDERGW